MSKHVAFIAHLFLTGQGPIEWRLEKHRGHSGLPVASCGQTQSRSRLATPPHPHTCPAGTCPTQPGRWALSFTLGPLQSKAAASAWMALGSLILLVPAETLPPQGGAPWFLRLVSVPLYMLWKHPVTSSTMKILHLHDWLLNIISLTRTTSSKKAGATHVCLSVLAQGLAHSRSAKTQVIQQGPPAVALKRKALGVLCAGTEPGRPWRCGPPALTEHIAGCSCCTCALWHWPEWTGFTPTSASPAENPAHSSCRLEWS